MPNVTAYREKQRTYGRCMYSTDTGMRRSRNRAARSSYGWYVASLRQVGIASEGGSGGGLGIACARKREGGSPAPNRAGVAVRGGNGERRVVALLRA
jgi:hypothetical protein